MVNYRVDKELYKGSHVKRVTFKIIYNSQKF